MSASETDRSIKKFIQGLGQRVRSAREKKNLSRREVCEASGVSQRYLAQIEAGEGNISIALLMRVAFALGESVHSLVIEPEVPKARRFALIGLRGAGKSTLGMRAGKAMGIPFLELNRGVEELAGVPVNEVLALYGPDGYRRLESQALERLIATQNEVILAVAGGVVSESETFEHLLRHFHCIWLRAKPEEHMERVRAQGDLRPMKDKPEAMAQLRQLLASREKLYARAEVQIDTSAKRVEQSVADLVQAIKSI